MDGWSILVRRSLHLSSLLHEYFVVGVTLYDFYKHMYALIPFSSEISTYTDVHASMFECSSIEYVCMFVCFKVSFRKLTFQSAISVRFLLIYQSVFNHNFTSSQFIRLGTVTQLVYVYVWGISIFNAYNWVTARFAQPLAACLLGGTLLLVCVCIRT